MRYLVTEAGLYKPMKLHRQCSFEYTRPLASAGERIARQHHVAAVRACLSRNEYISLLAQRQTGKTTFLSELRDVIKNCVILDLESRRWSDPSRVSGELATCIEDDEFDAKRFFRALCSIAGEEIIFLVDEVKSLGRGALDFLKAVRKYYIQSFDQGRIVAHKFIIAGSVDLADVSLDSDPDVSPYNIAVPLYFGDFGSEDIEAFIITHSEGWIARDAIAKIIDYTEGHPYLMQFVSRYLCSLSQRDIGRTLSSLENVVRDCGIEASVNVQSMIQQLFEHEDRTAIMQRVLRGEAIPFSLSNATVRALFLSDGCIRESGGHCVVRNPIYRLVLERNFEIRGSLSRTPVLTGGAGDNGRVELLMAIQRLEQRFESALMEPQLDNFRGAVTVCVVNERGGPVPSEVLSTGQICFSVGIRTTCGIAVRFLARQLDDNMGAEVHRELVVQGGNTVSQVTFGVTIDSLSIDIPSDRLSTTFPVGCDSEVLLFEFNAADGEGDHELFVEISQKNRLLQSLCLVLRVH